MKIFAFAAAAAVALTACTETVYVPSSGGNDGRNRVVDIVNQTGVTLTHFQASNTSQNIWGPDQLGSSVISSGQYMTLNFDDGTGACMYDFRARFADGDVAISNNVNVCVESGWTYH